MHARALIVVVYIEQFVNIFIIAQCIENKMW